MNYNHNISNNIYETTDYLTLAEGVTAPFDSRKTGLNNNVLVIGSTGAGKTMSYSVPQMLHISNSSIVVTLTKRKLLETHAPAFLEKGYDVQILDLTDAEKGTIGFDPMKFVQTDNDILHLAQTIIGIHNKDNLSVSRDPYWDDAAASLLAAEIGILIEEAVIRAAVNRVDFSKEKPAIKDVLDINSSLKFNLDESNGFTSSSLDDRLGDLKEMNKDSFAVRNFGAVDGLTPKTLSCILSILNTALASMFTPRILEACSKPCIDLESIAMNKTALFIVTSPVNCAAQHFVNLIYAQIFKSLFELAEKQPDHRLPNPIHIICDDFATGGKIPNFAEYISVFRECGMSAAILVQSITQLQNIYGVSNAATIMNNCDRTLFLGSNDISSCIDIARALNRPVQAIQQMPVGKAVVIQRGNKPVLADRWDTLNDEAYIKLNAKGNPASSAPSLYK